MTTGSDQHSSQQGDEKHINWKGYANLLAMVLTSTVVMYFFMYWNIYRIEDFVLSETRAFMSMLMGGTMLAIMLSFMLHMYKSRAVNLALYAVSALLFAAGLYLVRSQVTVQDESWMKSMIPHHSIAIMVSERATLSDPRVRKLADEIIAAQEKEIAEMAYLIRAIEAGGEVGDDFPLGEPEGPAPVGTLPEALGSAGIAGIDLATMTPEEVRMVVPEPACVFRFSEGQRTVLGVGADGAGVMKLAGQLVPVAGPSDIVDGGVFATEGARLAVEPMGAGGDAALIFELDADPALRVGYDGTYLCS